MRKGDAWCQGNWERQEQLCHAGYTTVASLENKIQNQPGTFVLNTKVFKDRRRVMGVLSHDKAFEEGPGCCLCQVRPTFPWEPSGTTDLEQGSHHFR